MIASQISNRAIWCLLIAQLLAVLSHVFHLPWAVTILCFVAAALRLAYQHQKLASPNKLIKVLMMLAATAAIFISYKSPLGLEPSAALLLAAFALKSLELETRRDFYLLVYVCFFVIAVRFIFDQGLLLSLYLLALSLLLLLALLLLNADISNLAARNAQARLVKPATVEPVRFTRVVRQAMAWLFQAIPLMLLLFFFFPRLAPFWSMPLPSSSASTGMSSFMSPGDISDLAQSNDLVFTASFKGAVPAQEQLYWRGLVLYDFDGREWRPGVQRHWPLEADALAPSNRVDYTQVMQPSGQTWLFALTPSSLARQAGQVITKRKVPYEVSATGDVSTFEPLSQRVNLAWHRLAQPLETHISAYQRRQALNLPHSFNPQTAQFMAQMRKRYPEDGELVQAVLAYFQQQEFFYTLQPPLLGRHSVDEFLFSSRQGFCEHYANAFTVMMRMAGIPTRVALGYQGGKLNPHEGFLAVYQYDAHAWSEVWLAGKGWVRVDPTAAVAPSRVRLAAIDQASDAIAFGAGQAFGSWGKDVLLGLQQRYEQLNYLWQSKVMGFDAPTQENIIRKWLGGFDSWRILLVVGAVLALVLLPGLWTLLRQPQKKLLHPLDRSYLYYCRVFEKHGLSYQAGLTPLQFAAVCKHRFEHHSDEIEAITAHYMQLRYASDMGESNAQIQQFERLCKTFKISKS